MNATPLLLILLLAACSAEQPRAEQGASAEPAAAVSPNAPAAKARLAEEKGDLLEFTYGWPAEAAAIPKLDAALEADLAKQRSDALAMAKEDQAGRTEELPFNGHYFSKMWTTEGDGGKLLSLAASTETFTGGAHGNMAYETILWDRGAGEAIDVAELFSDPEAAFGAMRAAYCNELDRQRAEKRGETLPLKGEDWLTGCRPLSEMAIAPVDADKDGKFELLRVLIAPYEAGPWAEGTYEVDIAVTDGIRRLVKREYAGAFEARPVQPQ